MSAPKYPPLTLSPPAASGTLPAQLDHELLLAIIGENIIARVPADMAYPEGDQDDETVEEAATFAERLDDLAERLERIETVLDHLVQLKTIKESYGTAEVADLLGKAEFTVREWCRLGRVKAEKRECGRGRSQEWIISHAELERIRNEGLLPQPHTSTRLK
jgi:hypothetical protein